MENILQNLVGNPSKLEQFPLLNPQQQGLQNQSISQIQQILGRLQPGMNGNFGQSPIAQQATNRFQTQTVPMLAERFQALGGNGTRRSSGLLGSLSGAGADLDTNIAALEQGNQNQLLQLLLGFAQRPSYENIHFPGTSGLFGNLTQGFGQGLGSATGAYFGGPAASAVGNAAGTGLDYLVNLIVRKIREG
jgi:hypothetical protein